MEKEKILMDSINNYVAKFNYKLKEKGKNTFKETICERFDLVK